MKQYKTTYESFSSLYGFNGPLPNPISPGPEWNIVNTSFTNLSLDGKTLIVWTWEKGEIKTIKKESFSGMCGPG